MTDSLGLLHGGSCSQYVLGFKGHHGLHLQDGGIGQSVVHAVFSSANNRILTTVPNENALMGHSERPNAAAICYEPEFNVATHNKR